MLEKLEISLVENATLAYYEVGVETEIVVDARPVGLGAVLIQRKRGGHIPVIYISSGLSQVEQRYSHTEREALAVRWACERLRMYLVGAISKIITDIVVGIQLQPKRQATCKNRKMVYVLARVRLYSGL